MRVCVYVCVLYVCMWGYYTLISATESNPISHPCDVIALRHHTDPGGGVSIDGLEIPE